MEKLKTFGKSIYLGNLYSLSLSRVKDQVQDLLSGNIFNTVNAVIDYAEHTNSHIQKYSEKSIGEKKLWEQPTDSNLKPSGNLFDIDIAKNDIIKRQQQTNILNTKRSLF